MKTDMYESMSDRWRELMEEVEGQNYLSSFVFDQLMYQYAEEERHYHTIEHIYDCLVRLDEYVAANPDLVKVYVNLPALKAAIWFHDVVYNAVSKHNEASSAAFAGRWIGYIDSPGMLLGVPALIRATTHKNDALVPNDLTTQLMLDIDLASLGYEPKVFDQNGRDIRQEYSFVPDLTFYMARAKILRGFLDRPRLYNTDWFFDRYEKQARENLAREIKECECVE